LIKLDAKGYILIKLDAKYLFQCDVVFINRL